MVYGSSTVKRRTNAELAEVDEAIVEAVRSDHPVTLRGVYYRVVSAGDVEKTDNGYRLIGRQLLKLRRDGTVPYSHITDGTRWIRKPKSWSDVDEMLEDAATSYRRALWHNQNVEVHIFTEKDAISGVLMPVTARWDVPLGVIRGFASETFAHSVAETIMATARANRATCIYQLGDHDPSGLDAWRDFRDKVMGFVPGGMGPHLATFSRLAVTPEQIEEYELPTRPTKASDSRAKSFAGGSVEVDAIPAGTLREIVEEAITQHIDPEQLRLTRVAEDSEREILQNMIGGDGRG